MGTGYISSKRTDGKLILLEISISRNISVHETVKEKIICSKPKINTATKTMKLKNRSLLAKKISIDKNLKLAIKREKSKFHSLKTFWTFSQLIQRRCYMGRLAFSPRAKQLLAPSLRHCLKLLHATLFQHCCPKNRHHKSYRVTSP